MAITQATRELASVFDALSEPHRLIIFRELLQRGPVCVGDLALSVTMSDPLTSQHLKVLHSAGLVTKERQGKFVYYRVNPSFKYIDNLADMLQRYPKSPL